MIELIGILGGALFAAGCVPMAYKTWHLGRDLGTPLETQWLLFLACIFYSWFLFAAFGYQHLAFWFLVIEVISWGTALWFHYFPRMENRHSPLCPCSPICPLKDECEDLIG